MQQPPNLISQEQRHTAETIIMHFRKTPSPYAMCREIFENSTCDLLIFEAADTLKRSVVAEWNVLEDENKLLLRQYLLNYSINRDIPTFIRAKILQVVAIMIKRSSMIDAGTERTQILEEMAQMIKFGDLRQKYVACRIIYVIMQEFLTTIKSDDTGLTFEEHFKAKKLFELSDLKKIFIMIFEAAEHLLTILDLTNTEHAHLLLEYITITELILLWGFVSPLLPKRLINALEMSNKIDQSPSLRLSAQWEAIMLNPKLTEIYFSIYWKVRDIPELHTKALTCLVQLSTLNGPILEGPNNRLKYISTFLTHFLHLVARLVKRIFPLI